MGFVIVFLGAGLGGACRHGVGLVAARLLGTGGFPFATLVINVTGSLAMGAVIGLFATRNEGVSMSLRLFLTTGILGGFTTFSAFSLEAILLWERGEATACLLYVAGSVLLSLAGLALGLGLVRQFG